MLDTLRYIDFQLFQFINITCANVAADVLCPWFREKLFWIPLYLLLTVWGALKFKHQIVWLVLFAIITIIVSDQLASHVVKPIFHRIRPCNNLEIMAHLRMLVTHCGNGFSFVSAHAANHFALAAFVWYTFPKTKWLWLIYLWAAVIGISQVYVGVHFPADILGGALLGFLIGWITAKGCTYFMRKIVLFRFHLHKKT
jgi:PAP2 superfamily.